MREIQLNREDKMKKLIIAILAVFALSAPSFAEIIYNSTNTAIALNPLYLRAGESLTYESSGTYTGTVLLEKSRDSVNYEPIGISTANQVDNAFTGTIYNGDEGQFFRFRISTITAGTVEAYLYDRDDLVNFIKNRKSVEKVYAYDDTVRLNTKLVYTPEATVTLNSTTEIDETIFKNTFNVITSSGGALLMASVPTIDTTRPVDGTMLIIQSSTNTVTFQDAGTLAGSGLELGSNTRALGVGDILELIFRNGSWYEIGFYNN